MILCGCYGLLLCGIIEGRVRFRKWGHRLSGCRGPAQGGWLCGYVSEAHYTLHLYKGILIFKPEKRQNVSQTVRGKTIDSSSIRGRLKGVLYHKSRVVCWRLPGGVLRLQPLFWT